MGLLEARVAERRVAATDGFETLVQGVVDYGIYMLDPDGRIATWNLGAERIKGYKADEILGRHFSVFYTPEDQAAGLPDRALKMAAEDGRFSSEGWRVRRDGTRFWAVAVMDRIMAPDGRIIGFAKITRDLSGEREAQQDLERSRAQLAQLQKMEAVGQLSGGLAHDFNNLLTGISGSLELLRRRLEQGQTNDLMRYIDVADAAAARASALTNRLLAFSRRQTLAPRPTCARDLITDMQALVQGSVGPEIEIETEFEPGLWATLCDPHQLENALLNLCLNARDAMDGAGTIRITATNAVVDLQMAATSGVLPGQYVQICIGDTGIGMPPDILAHAIEPFFTTKPVGQGTGLGLSMVYGFANQSGGGVDIRSQEGRGTTVSVLLPRSEPADVAVLRRVEDAPPAAPRADDHQTILVVDDEPSVRTFLIEILEELGYITIAAEDGQSGLRILRSDRTIDLLVSDVGLPGGMNGKQMVDAAREHRPDLRVLYITGYAQSTVFGDREIEPGTAILTKPFGIDGLANGIKALIEER